MDSRAEFQVWAEAHYVSPAFFKISGSDDYANEIIQNAWEGWQASRQALEGEPVAEIRRFGFGNMRCSARFLVNKNNLAHVTKLYTKVGG